MFIGTVLFVAHTDDDTTPVHGTDGSCEQHNYNCCNDPECIHIIAVVGKETSELTIYPPLFRGNI